MPTTRAATARRIVAQRRGVTLPSRSALQPRDHWAFLYGGPYPEAAPPATEADALGLPVFGRGVALLCNAAAGTDWRAMTWDAQLGVSVRKPLQPQVLRDPDPTTTPWHYRWSAVEDLILYGNHFAIPGPPDTALGSGVDGTGYPGLLAPIPADDVWLMVDPETGGWSWAIGGELFTPGTLELFHVSAGNRSGEPLGRGVLRQYGRWLSGSVAAEDHAAAYFAGGALPPAVLQSPQIIEQRQADELKAKWRAMTSSHEPVVLPTGYVLTPLVSNAEQAQLVESRQWNAQAVAQLLGIPAYKLGLPGTSMTYQNVESGDIDFVRDSVDRYARPLAEAFSKWLMPAGTTVAWDYAGRMRADSKSQAEVLGALVTAQILTRDEARAVLGRPPAEDSTEDNGTPAGVPELTPEEVGAGE